MGRCTPGYIAEAHMPYTNTAVGAMNITFRINASHAEMFLTKPEDSRTRTLLFIFLNSKLPYLFY
ncbi:MAG: hypothetical protein QXR65_00270 [Candidatus Bathyarchaeia archaeon]